MTSTSDLRALWEKTTQPVWELDEPYEDDDGVMLINVGSSQAGGAQFVEEMIAQVIGLNRTVAELKANAAFIATAHREWPALMDKVEELERLKASMADSEAAPGVRGQLQAPPGWMLVPLDPTAEMDTYVTNAVAAIFDKGYPLNATQAARSIYRAMIAAAPPTPQDGPDQPSREEIAADVRDAFEVGCAVQPKGGGLVRGELLEFNTDATGALIRWNDGHEIWKNLKNLEVIDNPFREEPINPSDDTVARLLYAMDPIYEDGETLEGFTVSPGGYLTWEQFTDRCAEFGDDKLFHGWADKLAMIQKTANQITDGFTKAAPINPSDMRVEEIARRYFEARNPPGNDAYAGWEDLGHHNRLARIEAMRLALQGAHHG